MQRSKLILTLIKVKLISRFGFVHVCIIRIFTQIFVGNLNAEPTKEPLRPGFHRRIANVILLGVETENNPSVGEIPFLVRLAD